jgi:ATP-dependent DNA helicase RecG
MARERLAYDEVFANQLALSLVRASSRKRRGSPLQADGSLRALLKLPYEPTGAQRRAIGEIEGDPCAGRADAAAAPGRCRFGKTWWR